jgi:hypothetical protein
MMNLLLHGVIVIRPGQKQKPQRSGTSSDRRLPVIIEVKIDRSVQ